MQGYSRSRGDWKEYRRKYLISKYNKMDNKNKELVLISTPDCSRCRFLRKPLEKRCKENGYKFKEMEYGPGMEEVTSVPCAMIGNDVILDYDGIVELVNSTSGKKSFY